MEKFNELRMMDDSNITSKAIFSNSVISWFQSLFTVGIPCETSHAIMDMFLLMGHNTIFWVGLSLVSSMKPAIMTCGSIEHLQGKILKGTKNKEFRKTK